MLKKYVLAIDAGTTSSRAIVFDKSGTIIGMCQKEFPQYFPHPGWVEHDAMEIWDTQLQVLNDVLDEFSIQPSEIDSIGITNQRETVVLWDKRTGEPVHRAIVWQCRRTSSRCKALQGTPLAQTIKETTGLLPDPYFSASKIEWILNHNEKARKMADEGHLLFGTIDTWILWNLTGGSVHATDVSNASRTMLYDIKKLTWSEELLQFFNIPPQILPQVHSSSHHFGETKSVLFKGTAIPISGIAGDQQAALFGQACFEPGEAKNTYGTGCFLVMNTGDKVYQSKHGLLTTIAWKLGNKVTYALEGSVFSAGATIQWLRDGLGLIQTSAETGSLAEEVQDNGGVYFVPAFAGLGAPHWDMDARGSLFGLTRGTQKQHIVRAALESIAYQTRDLLDAVQADTDIALEALQVDGGASANDFLLQFQADMLQKKVVRPVILESTAWGAALLAGLQSGFWPSIQSVRQERLIERVFSPIMDSEKANSCHKMWTKAVQRAGNWIESH